MARRIDIKPKKRSESNKTILQAFEYYLDDEDKGKNKKPEDYHWNYLATQAKMFADIGITDVWLPPAYKSFGMADSVGYAVYDKYDLGQYYQQDRTETRYGSKDDLDWCIKNLKHHHLKVIVDIVMNHMMGGEGDASILTTVTECDPQDRLNEAKRVKVKKKVWPVFRFDERRSKASSLNQDVWDQDNFTGFVSDPTDEDQYLDGRKADLSRKNIPYLFEGKEWAQDVDWELGNYDALMGMNLDMSNPDTRKKLIDWGKWFIDETQADGVRIDAVKHISASFMRDWLNEITIDVAEKRGIEAAKEFFVVGEYWSEKQDRIEHYLEEVNQSEPVDDSDDSVKSEPNTAGCNISIDEILMKVFDVQLHSALAMACEYDYTKEPFSDVQKTDYDMTQIFNNSLLDEKSYQDYAVTFVDNHDTQAGQPLGPSVNPRFKQQAYALIMFRVVGIPCVFYGDLYGIPAYKAYQDVENLKDDPEFQEYQRYKKMTDSEKAKYHETMTEDQKKQYSKWETMETMAGHFRVYKTDSNSESGQDPNQIRCNEMMSPVIGLKRMCRVRQVCAHGGEKPYFNQKNKIEIRQEDGTRVRHYEYEETNDIHAQNVIGYTRNGGNYTYGGMAVLVSNRWKDNADDKESKVYRWMFVSQKFVGQEFVDILHPDAEPVKLNKHEHGYGKFYVEKGGTAVWIRRAAYEHLMKEEEFRKDI